MKLMKFQINSRRNLAKRDIRNSWIYQLFSIISSFHKLLHRDNSLSTAKFRSFSIRLEIILRLYHITSYIIHSLRVWFNNHNHLHFHSICINGYLSLYVHCFTTLLQFSSFLVSSLCHTFHLSATTILLAWQLIFIVNIVYTNNSFISSSGLSEER